MTVQTQQGYGGGDVVEVDNCIIEKPVAFTCGAYELGWPPEKVFRDLNPNTRFYEVSKEGGHFLAQEKPAVLAEAIRKHFDQDDIKDLLQAKK